MSNVTITVEVTQVNSVTQAASPVIELISQSVFVPAAFKGDPGPQGIQGIQGPKGDDGDPGPAGSVGMTRVITLSTSTYTLQDTDNETIFLLTVPCTVTVPELANMPSCIFFPAFGASLTLTPGSGNVYFDGLSAVQVRSVITDPTGVVLLPNYGTANRYSTSVGTFRFANLTGVWSDNASLLAAMALKQSVDEVAALTFSKGNTKLNGNVTLDPTMRGFFLYVNAATTDKTITWPAGLGTNFRLRLGKLVSGAGNLVIAPAGGVLILSKSGGTKINTFNSVTDIVCTGTADQYVVVNGDLST